MTDHSSLSPRPGAAPNEASDAKEDRHFVTALARGLDVLACFRRGETFLANHEIADRCNLPRSTVSRLTYTLTRTGHLHYVDDVGKYRLGAALIALGSTALGGLDVRRIARPALRELANFSTVSAGLGIREGLSMCYVECSRGQAAISLNNDVGTRLPIASTSMGRAYLAVCAPQERAAIYHELEGLDFVAWSKLRERLDRSLIEYREIGCSTSFGDWQDPVSAIAVGFQPGGGLPPMAINCGGPTVITSPSFLLDEVRPRLIELARGLDGVMGA
jgi:DNA-binding IclR family transcriptional regulator